MPDDYSGAVLVFAILLPGAVGLLVVGTLIVAAVQIAVASRFTLGSSAPRAVLLVNVVTNPTLEAAWLFTLAEMKGVGLLAKLTMLVVLQVGVIWIHNKLYARSLGTTTPDGRGWLRFAAVANMASAAPGFALFILLAIDQTRAALRGILG
jgi:hypothetical protein